MTSSLTPVDRTEPRTLIWGSQGKAGSGKTRFALTAPGPIAVLLFDPVGLRGLLNRPEFKDKEILVAEYKFNPAKLGEVERQERAAEIAEQFEADYEAALEQCRTIIVDKEDQLWQLYQSANPITDGNKRRGALNYSEINAKMRSLVHEAAARHVNLGMLRGVKEEWKGGSPTGNIVPRGMKEVPELVQVYLDHRWDEDERAFMVRIHEKCRLGNAVELLGQEFAGLDFMQLGMLLYPGSSPEEWT